jgi:hypothetical protein
MKRQLVIEYLLNHINISNYCLSSKKSNYVIAKIVATLWQGKDTLVIPGSPDYPGREITDNNPRGIAASNLRARRTNLLSVQKGS